ncbi:MAG: 7-carboxy-7-deazaguanine synthase QueE [Alphaproteobacteria bacterium]
MIRISEIFGPTIQGEGALIGQPTVFVRTGGCDYRCSWCDTLHAVDSEYRHGWKPMNAEGIFAQVEKLSGGQPIMVSLSGGNPAIQPLKPLLDLGHAHGYSFALETQGSIAQDWFSDLDVLTLSPKPPSSGMTTDWKKFEDCLKAAREKPKAALKIVVFDDADFDYAKEASARYQHLPLYLQPGNSALPPAQINNETLAGRMRWLTDKTLNAGLFHATILPQLHVMLWGNKRGV